MERSLAELGMVMVIKLDEHIGIKTGMDAIVFMSKQMAEIIQL